MGRYPDLFNHLFGETMRHIFVILTLAAVAASVGCAKSDPRLSGTWRSNREESVADAFRRDPRWTNASPEKIERFRDMFGHMTLSYSNGTVTTSCRGEERSLRY